MVPPTLEGARVRLRPHRADDREAVFALFGDASVIRYWAGTRWTSIAEADAYLAPLLLASADAGEPDKFPWAIADGPTDAFIGTTSIFALRRDQQRAEVGYSLLPARQGHGLAREAVVLALRYAFDVLQLRRVEADVDPRNGPSCKLLESLGFTREGFLRERWNINDEICDTVFYGVLARELREAR
jgi:[ribosomal protein S5]-alanine N-acetyltransferase